MGVVTIIKFLIRGHLFLVLVIQRLKEGMKLNISLWTIEIKPPPNNFLVKHQRVAIGLDFH